jgi:soluble P-type ATPase
MALVVEVPGTGSLRLEYLLLDVNGTLADRGMLLPGVAERLTAVSRLLEVRLLTADTYGTLGEITAALGGSAAGIAPGITHGITAQRVEHGQQKAAIARNLGAQACAAVGNGANDALMLATVALGIAVLGPEGAAPATLQAADVVCPSILVALDLLADPRALAATLRP